MMAKSIAPIFIIYDQGFFVFTNMIYTFLFVCLCYYLIFFVDYIGLNLHVIRFIKLFNSNTNNLS